MHIVKYILKNHATYTVAITSFLEAISRICEGKEIVYSRFNLLPRFSDLLAAGHVDQQDGCVSWWLSSTQKRRSQVNSICNKSKNVH